MSRDRTRRVAWIGDTAAAELAWARAAVIGLANVRDLPRSVDGSTAGRAGDVDLGSPVVVVLASDWPGRFGMTAVVEIARRWPLAVIVSVATCLAEGRRRSGPPLPGIEEVPWNDLPARMAWWFAELDAGRPGPLGLPGTGRREDRFDVVARSTRRWRDAAGDIAGTPAPHRPQVVVAADCPENLDGTAAAVAAAGGEVIASVRGLPPIDMRADAMILEHDHLGDEQCAWLRRLAERQPHCRPILLDSFPRHETVTAAIACGAVAVLTRPVSLEALAGGLWGECGGRPQAADGPVSRA
jgi:CheY-like chemotaxis protein